MRNGSSRAFTKTVDSLIWTLLCILGALFFTGGYVHSGPKIELAEIDSFAAALMALVLLRKWKTDSWFPAPLEKAIAKIVARLNQSHRAAIWGAVAIYSLTMCWIQSWRHLSFQSNAFDLGYIYQATSSLGKAWGPLYSSLSRGHSYFGEHFSPILYLPSLIETVIPSVYALFALQTLIIVFSAFLVDRLAKSYNLTRAGRFLCVLGFLLYQPTRAANQFDFREDLFFIPIFFSMLLSLRRGRFGWAGVFAALSWLVKENAPLFTAFTAIWVFASKEFRRKADPQKVQIFSIFVFGVSAIVFALVNLKIIPYFSGGGGNTMLVNRLPQLGSSNSEILSGILLSPIVSARALLGPLAHSGSIKYFLKILLPFIPFALVSPWSFAIAVIGACMNRIVNFGHLGFHYECILIPFLFFTLVKGLATVTWTKNANVIAAIALSFIVFFGRSPVWTLRSVYPTDADTETRSVLKKIPKDASVSTTSPVFPHLANRKDIHLLSRSTMDSEYLVFLLDPEKSNYGTPDLSALLKEAATKVRAGKLEIAHADDFNTNDFGADDSELLSQAANGTLASDFTGLFVFRVLSGENRL